LIEIYERKLSYSNSQSFVEIINDSSVFSFFATWCTYTTPSEALVYQSAAPAAALYSNYVVCRRVWVVALALAQ